MTRFERELLKRNILSVEQLDILLQQAKDTYSSLTEILLKEGYATEEDILRIQADLHGLEFVSLSDISPDKKALSAVSAKVASHYSIFPLKLDGTQLTIAVSDSFDMSAKDDIESSLGFSVQRVLACSSEINAALKKYYGIGADTVQRLLSENDTGKFEESQDISHDLDEEGKEATVVRLVNQIIEDAIKERASDIHFEIDRDNISIRRRIDGILFDAPLPDNIKLIYPSIVSRLKLMAGMNIVERRLPQDGRSRVRIANKEYDLRISIIPAVYGEDIVVRILPADMLFGLEEIGFNEYSLSKISDLISNPHGIIFLTGPTGSGKSTTLYACLNKLNSRQRKIITIEDPVEYEMKGITQTQIKPEIGLTFASALRSMLRHDPDVMMVGEVRDRETAEIAIQTAMTGHLVLSTLHTNDAAGGASRLIDMGIPPYLITSTVLSFIAQRLLRKICDNCKEEALYNGEKVFRGSGCRLCNNTGYKGRIAICEFIDMDDPIQKLIMNKASASEIRAQADNLDMKKLFDDGWEKVRSGITTVEEVLRVTSL